MMNIERGFARAIKALDKLALLWIGFCILKIIQCFPSGEDAQWIRENDTYWRLAYRNCFKGWECLPSSVWGHLKEVLPFYFSVIEWLGIFLIGALVITSLIHILRGFLDDEGLFADE
jgi:hypothetical protein